MSLPPRRCLHNLPAQLTSFIGREREIAEIKRLLSTTRLLTLTGAGGCGKTRLALQVAANVLEHYPDGVWVAQLAPLSDPALVPKVVASGLDIPEQPARPLTETVAAFVQTKRLLMVLDNCEHLLQACAHLVDTLLRLSPDLQILATSREGLGIEGELIFRIPSLSVPDPKRLPPPDALVQYEAIRLFVERATLSKPGFELTGSNAAVLADMVHRLDGIPLAIELAAGRLKGLSVDAIATRLNDQFRLLTGGSRTGLPRHQTLRATLDWSYDLLSEPERILLRRLSVFSGGFTLDAAEKICAGTGVAASDILDFLPRLVDKSLVILDERDAHGRYRLLETVRQYGTERAQDASEADAVRRRHRDWYLALAEEAEPKLRGPDQKPWLERLEVEHDNLRAALDWCGTEQDDAEAEMCLAGALRQFWYIRGYWHEGRDRLERALARSDGAPHAILSRALQGASYLTWGQGDNERAAELSEQGLRLCHDAGDEEGAARFLVHMALVAFNRGDHEQAANFCEDALAVFRERGEPWLVSWALHIQGAALMIHGDYERARGPLEENLTFASQAGDPYRIAFALRSLGWLACSEGDYSQARVRFKESLMRCQEVGGKQVTAECLAGLAWGAAAQGIYDDAARLFGAADTLFVATGYRPAPGVRAGFEQYMASTRAHMGGPAYDAAWAQGQAMTFEQAIEYAIATANSPATDHSGKRRTRMLGDAGLLTTREREVAVLIAQGLSNRDAAARLVISERTVETHVQNILNKLGADSRTFIATWAVRHGLLAFSPE